MFMRFWMACVVGPIVFRLFISDIHKAWGARGIIIWFSAFLLTYLALFINAAWQQAKEEMRGR